MWPIKYITAAENPWMNVHISSVMINSKLEISQKSRHFLHR